ncbi:MAG TPA: Holliday junction resolvase RuvX, partial [bacterium]|nr:Holliday junction resolvase RuvX [bacterium]
DERLTSKQAERLMIEGGARRDQRREKVDQVAAALILESALRGAPLAPVEPS